MRLPFLKYVVWFHLTRRNFLGSSQYVQTCPQTLLRKVGPTLAPPLRPRPWGAGAVSLNPPSLSFHVLLQTCFGLQA